MAVCKVIKQTEGWNVGDEIEAEGDRLDQLIADGIVSNTKPEPVVEVPEVFEEVKEQEVISEEQVQEVKKSNKKGSEKYEHKS